MTVPTLNSSPTADTYMDANTVVFTQPRSQFQAQISNAAVKYQVAVPGVSGFAGDVVWESLEHDLLPSFTTFDSDDARALGQTLLAGIRFRSQSAGRPGIVSVS